jgi:AcrR family transcriptional regulator
MSKGSSTSAWREARRANARADLVAAAWELVREGGLGALSLRELARRAGTTTPTVYAYFDSKNAIFDAMFAEAAQNFADNNAHVSDEGTPEDVLVAHARRFAAFCTSDVPRYQLLFQHTIPGFHPSAEAFAPAVRALEDAKRRLARAGVRDPRHVDLWTALMTGLVDQQISNDPGGDRWSRLIEDAVLMFLGFCRGQEAGR